MKLDGIAWAICEERGPEWTAYAVALSTHRAYCRRKMLQGLDGALSFAADYKELIDQMAAGLPFPVLSLRDCQGDWGES